MKEGGITFRRDTRTNTKSEWRARNKSDQSSYVRSFAVGSKGRKTIECSRTKRRLPAWVGSRPGAQGKDPRCLRYGLTLHLLPGITLSLSAKLTMCMNT